MHYHAKAALTQTQRAQVQALATTGISQAALARRFGVSRRTIQRWIGRSATTDRSSAPHHHGRRVVTDAYRTAILALRQAHPTYGPKRIAHELRDRFPTANTATIWRVLTAAGLIHPQEKKRPRRKLPVGRHRVQLDIQELPAIKGQRGRAYKISLIHMRTRMKYSEIHRQATSRIVADVLHRAIGRLPPFHVVVTDNAMVFTMAYSAHPERQTTFERTVAALGLRHWRIACRSPWQNGIIERSNRTDNDECFHQYTFTSSEERRYIHRLWEMYYNHQRPHQGIAGATPVAVFQADYPPYTLPAYAPTL